MNDISQSWYLVDISRAKQTVLDDLFEKRHFVFWVMYYLDCYIEESDRYEYWKLIQVIFLFSITVYFQRGNRLIKN